MKRTLLIIGLVVSIALLGWLVCFYFNSSAEEITNFEECEVAGYPVMEIYPRQCRAGNQTFTEIIPDGGDTTLSTKTWIWAGTQMENGRVIVPKREGVFTVTFSEDGRVQLTTDCNSMGGEYRVDGNKIIFDKIMTTLIGCPAESQEGEFSVFLQETPSYRFTELGELIFEMDSGTMFLR
jgi:heat shock protein HslJ